MARMTIIVGLRHALALAVLLMVFVAIVDALFGLNRLSMSVHDVAYLAGSASVAIWVTK